MENNKVAIFSMTFLLFGLFGGYLLGQNKISVQPVASNNGTHVMPNGMVMSNTESMMSNSMSDMMAGLNGKTGDQFDTVFLSEMIVHHEGAVEMAQLALQNAKHQEIKDMANNIISAQTKEIAQMKSWQQAWYGK